MILTHTMMTVTYSSTSKMPAGQLCHAGLVMWRAVQLGPSFHLQHSPLFLVLLVFTMLERLTSFASDVAIERDWLTKLVGESQVDCMQTNAHLPCIRLQHNSICSCINMPQSVPL